MEFNDEKRIYTLIKIYIDKGDNCWLFDTIDSDYMHCDNISVLALFNLTEEEANIFKNKIAVYENTVNRERDKQDFKLVYRLVLNNEFSHIKELEIPETAVVVCHFASMRLIEKEEYKKYIHMNIMSLEDAKTKLRNSAEVQLDDITIDNIDRNGGLYYHKKTDKNIVSSHYLYFFNVELKKILSEITYAEFEKQMQDKVYKIVSIYLQKYHDGDRKRMDDHTIEMFFNDEYFYWPGAVPVNG